MKVALALFSLIGITASASERVNLDMTLVLNGRTVKPRIIVAYGQAGSVSEKNKAGDGFEIEVTPTEVLIPNEAKKSVQLNFIISEFKRGQSRILATSQIITHKGQAAMLAQSQPGGNDLKLAVTPLDAI